jgi:hypothetical protein
VPVLKFISIYVKLDRWGNFLITIWGPTLLLS